MIEHAKPTDELAVRRVLDAANLVSDDLSARIEDGEVLVAREEDRVLGVLVVDSDGTRENRETDDEPGTDRAHVLAIAVRRRRRNRGIGTALVEAAADRYGTLSADWSPHVEPFWASVGFESKRRERGGDERCWGRLERED